MQNNVRELEPADTDMMLELAQLIEDIAVVSAALKPDNADSPRNCTCADCKNAKD